MKSHRLLAPSSLAHLVLTATEKPTGTMNANALVTWKMDTAATLYSGSGSKPASRMFASDAHHSAIIKIPGSLAVNSYMGDITQVKPFFFFS